MSATWAPAVVMMATLVATGALDWWHRRWYRAASVKWIASNQELIDMLKREQAQRERERNDGL